MTEESVVSSRRTVILIVAVALGAFAALGLLNYVKNAESGAGEASSPIEVWVAKAPVPKGTSVEDALDQNLLGKELVAQKLRPTTAVRDPATELAGLVAVADLPVNIPIVTGSFVSPSIVNTGITDRLEERGLVTVTISVDQVRGAAYLIEPGDFVNIMLEREWDAPFFENDPPLALTPEATAELAAELAENDTTRPLITDLYPVETRMVYQKAEVLAVGSRLTPDLGQTTVEDDATPGQAQGLITLAVPPEAAQVILNVGRDSLYLSLVPDDYEPRAMLPLDPTTQVLPGESSSRLTPYQGVEGVDDPASEASALAFDGDAGDRIGVAPSTGSSGSDAGPGDLSGPEPEPTPIPEPEPEPDVTEPETPTTEGGEG
jgi:Flp pilus assembly protein CpaB